jgi:hypothetical protein
VRIVMAADEPTDIEVRLTVDEALVMSDWIYRLQNSSSPLVDDEAVWMPLYRIGGSLETTLAQIFAPDYKEQLEAARARLLAKLGTEKPDS